MVFQQKGPLARPGVPVGGPLSLGEDDLHALCRPGSDLLSRVLRRSTISAGAFHGRVRNGIGCSRSAITTRSAKCMYFREAVGRSQLSFVLQVAADLPSDAPASVRLHAVAYATPRPEASLALTRRYGHEDRRAGCSSQMSIGK